MSGFESPHFGTISARLNDALGEWFQSQDQVPAVEDRLMFAETHMTSLLAELGKELMAAGRPVLSVPQEDALRSAVMQRVQGTPWERWMDGTYSDLYIWPAHAIGKNARTGQREKLNIPAVSEQEFQNQIRQVAQNNGETPRRFDQGAQNLDMQLSNGNRLNALMKGVSHETCVTIRVHTKEVLHLEDLMKMGMIDEALLKFFTAAVASRQTIILSGAPGSGKTTLARALLHKVDPFERIVVVEQARELDLHKHPDLHSNIVSVEEKPPSLEGAGGFSMDDALRASLRQDPDRVVVGEIRGGEVASFLRAVTNGIPGSLCTLHANDTNSVYERLCTYGMLSEPPMGREAILNLAGQAVDLIVQVVRLPDSARRVVTSVRAITGVNHDAGSLVTAEIWAPASSVSPQAIPAAQIPPQLAMAVERHGFDLSMHQIHPNGMWPTP